jgi:hypothetical protein
VVIEPATRADTRALHRARGALIARGLGVFAPCTHQGECPMLARARDWCHEDLADAALPDWLVPVARDAGLRWQGLTFSYLVVRRDASRSVAELLHGTAGDAAVVPTRLVSQPRATKGKTEAFASGPFPGPSRGTRLMQLDRDARRRDEAVEGARDATHTDRDVAPALLSECERGDVVDVRVDDAGAGALREGRPVRLARTDLVRRVSR